MSVLAISFCLAYKSRLQHSIFTLGLNVFKKALVRMSELELPNYMTELFKPDIPRKPLRGLAL